MWSRTKMKIPFVLLTVLVTSASLATASFEFLNSKGKVVQEHHYIEKYGEIQLPEFFFPINKPSEAAAGPPPKRHHGENKRLQGANKASAQGTSQGGGDNVNPLPLSISKLPSLLTAVYLFSSVCFILCLRGLSIPQTAKRGNILGIVGMMAAIFVTFTEQGFDTHYAAFILTVIPAAIIGLYIGMYVKMVNLPQLVAMFHSFVGLAAMLVGLSTFHSPALAGTTEKLARYLEIYIGEFIATITFTGSIVAAAKLHEVMDPRPLRLPGRHTINGIVVSIVGVLAVLFCFSGDVLTQVFSLYFSVALSLFLGFHLVAAIGGADMPVVVSMLNSYSGFATAASGFMLDNSLLIIAGSLIGSSGAILSYIMCRGMNRDFVSVILGGWEEEPYAQMEGVEGTIRQTTADTVAEELINAKRVIIVPGYGMAVSRCQSEVSDIASMLRAGGINVEFAVHPVAGRMPGHMNVLLAEADVPYTIVKEMDEVNPDMPNVDVVLVVGANDTVNPAALDPNSKIAGMPVIEAWKAKRVVVLKRSMGRGYAAIDNPLFFMENTRMLFGDAKASTANISAAINQRTNLMASTSRFEERPSQERQPSIDETFPEPKATVGILKDVNGNTEMVAIAPRFVPKLRRMAFRVMIQEGAGRDSHFTDDMYREQGAEVTGSLDTILQKSDVLLKVTVPNDEFISNVPAKKILISYIWPERNPQVLEKCKQRDVTALAVDEVPRVTRAQKLDVRSSISNLQGYRAVIEAFSALPRLSKGSITAAGRIEAAKVFVIGAGVAGLQAISTARGLGAQVFAHDTRTATKEEVESLGGKFIAVPYDEEGETAEGYAREMGAKYKEAQEQVYRKIIKDCDVVICTAALPGKPSPKLISEDMVKTMKPGSVIMDLATEFGDRNAGWGGNCQLSGQDTEVTKYGVKIIGRDKIETKMPTQASELFSMNMIHLLEELGGGENLSINLDNEVIRGLTVTHGGQILWQQRDLASAPPREKIDLAIVSPPPPSAKGKGLLDQVVESDLFFAMCLFVAAAIIGIIGSIMDTLELQHLFLFVLALIVGYYCVWSVTPALHTPLMSVTNALSGVILIGSMVEYDGALNQAYAACALVATFLSGLNIAGGFYVTQRMLEMFSI